MEPVPSSVQRPTFGVGLRQALILTIVMFFSLAGYLLVLKWRGPSATLLTWIPADDWLPFWPDWVWVYLLPYALGPIMVGLLSPLTFWWYIRGGLVTVSITLILFVILPTQTEASARNVNAARGWTAEIYKNMVEIDDPPANAAPSLHVSLTCLLLLAMLRDYPRWWPVWTGFVLLVWLSTLLTRQHHLIDVATGALLALTVAWLLGSRRT